MSIVTAFGEWFVKRFCKNEQLNRVTLISPNKKEWDTLCIDCKRKLVAVDKKEMVASMSLLFWVIIIMLGAIGVLSFI